MRPLHVAFLAVFLLWQSAPVPIIERDSTGRIRLSVAGGAARWEEANFDCEGNFVSSDPAEMQAIGARLDADLSEQLRVTAAVANVRSERVWEGTQSGAMLAAQVAYEGARFGIGAGVTTNATPLDGTGPNFYLRIGRADGAHFRLDALEPSETFFAEPPGRIGVAFGRGRIRKVGGFLGLGASPYSQKAVGFGNLEIPAGPVDLMFRAMYGPGNAISEWGVGGGIRYHLR